MSKPKTFTYTNMLGEQVTVTSRKPNPMIRSCGKGPGEFKCKDCIYLIRKTYANTYFKCQWRGDSNGPGTDHRANWPTCGKFIKSQKA